MLSSPKLKEFYPQKSIISSFSSSKNLKEILAPLKCRKGSSQSVLTTECLTCDKTRCDFFLGHKLVKNKKVTIHFNRTPYVLSDFTFHCIDQIQTSTSENTKNLLQSRKKHIGVRSYFPYHFLGIQKITSF